MRHSDYGDSGHFTLQRLFSLEPFAGSGGWRWGITSIFYRNKPLLKKGGVMIVHHPCYDEFDHNFHPSYIEFFHRLLPETRDSFVLREKYEREFANNPSYVEMYRRGNAYHGAHPFFMW